MRLRFAPRARTGAVLWADDDATRAALGDPIDVARLPLSDATRAALDLLAARVDAPLDCCHPAEGAWQDVEAEQLAADADAALARVRADLGSAYVVVDGRPGAGVAR